MNTPNVKLTYIQNSSDEECNNIHNKVLELIIKHLTVTKPELFKTGK